MAAADSPPQLDDRDVRALTERMDIYVDDPATSSEEVAVYNGGERHIVNPATGWCSCDDYHYRQPDDGCKHLRRFEYATGRRPIPSYVQREALAPELRTGGH